MIGYLEGAILRMEGDRILLLAGAVGYEVLVPAFVRPGLAGRAPGDALSLFIYCHQTERQPLPVLIGFSDEREKAFFQRFLTVEAMGPLKAARALTLPAAEIAEAIESGNVAMLKNLKGVGPRTAQKIVATLGGRMGSFLGADAPVRRLPAGLESAAEQVLEVLTDQLGLRTADARRMIAEALERNAAIASAEELMDEIYRKENR
jgi:holliday junction DNA helicase RuvA